MGAAMMITQPNQIALYRLMVLRSGLRLEIKGIKVKGGKTCYSIIKNEFGLKGNRANVLEQLDAIINHETAQLGDA
jgi:uncharacterized protein (DUF2141 family)